MVKRNLLRSVGKALIFLGVCFGLWLSACSTSVQNAIKQNDSGESNPELGTRSFLMGMVPSPRSVPSSSFEDLVSAYQEVGAIADVAMIWGNPGGIGLYEKLLQSQVVTAVRVYGLKPVLTLNFHTVEEVPGQGLQLVIDTPEGITPEVTNSEFRELWVAEAKKIAQEFQPEYFSLGNEINDYFHFHPKDIDGYLTLFDAAYREIKEVSPETKVFVVFSYNHLIENQQWELVEVFSTRADIIGLTTYPWKHFETPADIEKDYYARLNDYLDRPLAFTEIGWPSTFSEADQAAFLSRFVELIEENEVEMVNWLFLHEMDVTGGIGQNVFSSETGTIALKEPDGRKKPVYDIWVDLYQGGSK